MKKELLTAIVLVFAYGAVYFVGQPFAMQSEALTHVWATAFHPLRLLQYRKLYEGELREVGTIHQGTISGKSETVWSLTYQQPKGGAPGSPNQGIVFRVPSHMLADVEAAREQLTVVTIGKEPDPERLNCASFVLRSIAPLR